MRKIVAVLVLLVAACGAEVDTSFEPEPTTVSPAVTSTEPTTTPTTEPTTTTLALAGDPFDLGPPAGAILAVVGVAHDDTLNLRAGPGTDQVVLAELDPHEDGIVALGAARVLPASIWFQVEFEGTQGWVGSSFIGLLGATDDITAAVVDALGETPVAETMLELGRIVADTQASTDPESRIRMSAAPIVGDLGEVTYDVIGLGDDSVFGVRLHVFGAPTDGGEGFSLKSVESTVICTPHRGMTDDGICN